jgi:hypothetical protein
VWFDINGLTLSVTDTATATLTRGTLISAKATSGVYVFGTLNVTGSITSTANTTVTNVNVNAKTASLAGTFNEVDLDGFGGNSLPSTPPIATITNDATFANFTGNATVGGNATTNGLFLGDLVVVGNATINGDFVGDLTVTGNTTLGGIFEDGTLTAGGNVTVSPPGGGFDGFETVVFNGTANQTFNLNNGSETFNTLWINKTGQTPSGMVTIATTQTQPVTLTLTTLSLTDGLLVTGDNNILLGNVVQGFVRNVAAGKVSHVFGNVTKTAAFGQFGRFEFPVGSMTDYRPAAITFTPANPVVTTTNITVRHVPVNPGGTEGFPITFPPNIVVDSTAGFSWLITSSIGLGPSQIYDLEFQGTGFTNYADVENIRVVRRLDGSVLNPWNPQGGTYTNFETGTPPNFIPIVRLIGSQGGMVPQASHFTYGMKKAVSLVSISGTVKYANVAQSPIVNATVTLNPGGVTTTTNATGNYSFANVTPGTYTITASKTGNWGGVNATDALIVSRFFAGLTTLDTLQRKAADVNNSSTINNTDALLIVQRFAGLITSFPKGDWVFTIGSAVVGSSDATVNLQGLAVGDVNNSYNPGPTKVSSGSLSLNTSGELKVANTQAFDMPVFAATDMAFGALSLKLSYPSDLVKFEGATASKMDGLITNEQNGVITLAWADMSGGKNVAQVKSNEAIATLRFMPKVKEGNVSVTVDASSELASANGIVISAASLASPVAKLSTLPTVFALDQNYPNPFNPSTQIEYSLPKSGRVTLTIYNIMGQEVAKLVDGVQEAGVYNVQWNASNLASGMYIYRINVDHENGNFTASKRLMLLK